MSLILWKKDPRRAEILTIAADRKSWWRAAAHRSGRRRMGRRGPHENRNVRGRL